MKHKLLTLLVFLTLGIGYCTPKSDCQLPKPPPSCRGTFPQYPLITHR